MMIVAENLRKTYITRERRGFRGVTRVVNALVDVSFRVRKGSIFSLVGPNGAGKTTTIKILSTLLIPDAGDAWVNGYHVVRDADKVRGMVGLMLYPDKGFYSRLTGFENLVYYGMLYGLKKRDAERRALEVLNLVGLGSDANRLYEEYSLGMRARLALAKALIHDPPVLFLDEPTIGIDPIAARRIRELILDLKRGGKTILLTSHNMWEVEALSDEVAVMISGRVVAVGTPSELKSRLRLLSRVEALVYCRRENIDDVPWGVERVDDNTFRVSFYSENPALDVVKLIECTKGCELKSLKVVEPSLEEVLAKLVHD